MASIAALDPEGSSLRTKTLPDISTSSELAFTTRKISANFSNFSAWHYRSKLLPKYWEEKAWLEGSSERKDHVDEGEQTYDVQYLEWSTNLFASILEFELVKQAMWSDPDDQSAWLYHRWLVGTGETFSLLRLVRTSEPFHYQEKYRSYGVRSLESKNYYLKNRTVDVRKNLLLNAPSSKVDIGSTRLLFLQGVSIHWSSTNDCCLNCYSKRNRPSQSTKGYH